MPAPTTRVGTSQSSFDDDIDYSDIEAKYVLQLNPQTSPPHTIAIDTKFNMTMDSIIPWLLMEYPSSTDQNWTSYLQNYPKNFQERAHPSRSTIYPFHGTTLQANLKGNSSNISAAKTRKLIFMADSFLLISALLMMLHLH
jgi:hypothetical protein